MKRRIYHHFSINVFDGCWCFTRFLVCCKVHAALVHQYQAISSNQPSHQHYQIVHVKTWRRSVIYKVFPSLFEESQPVTASISRCKLVSFHQLHISRWVSSSVSHCKLVSFPHLSQNSCSKGFQVQCCVWRPGCSQEVEVWRLAVKECWSFESQLQVFKHCE